MILEASPVTTVQGIAPEMLISAIRDSRIEPCLLSRHPKPSKIARLTCPNATLDFVTLGPALHCTGQINQSCYTIVFVLSCPTKARSFNLGADYTEGYMAFYPPGTLVESALPEGYANASLTVPIDFFQAELETHFPEIPEKVLRSGAGMSLAPEAQTTLRHLLSKIEHWMWHSPSLFDRPIVLRQVQRKLLSAFLAALRSGCSHIVPQPSNHFIARHRRLRQACDFFSAHIHESIHLDDLCSELKLSRRGVEKLFHDMLGVTPLTYFRRKRLNEVRRALRQAEISPGAVKFAALNRGFLHQGHFARDYRQTFGESPLETLSRHARS